MSNWVLELQGFDFVRLWIRGEANILADAPSRAPWENVMARHLPIPDMPVRELIKKMHQDPEGMILLMEDRRTTVFGKDPIWEPLGLEMQAWQGVDWEAENKEEVAEGSGPAFKDGYVTPEFGKKERSNLVSELGSFEILNNVDPEFYPKQPLAACTEDSIEKCLRGGVNARPVPEDRKALPCAFEVNNHCK